MTSRPILAIGPFRLDPADRLLWRDGRPVPLPPKAVETLLVLVDRPGRLVTKEDLLRAVWPDTFVEENNLAQHISTLRRVLGEALPEGPVIETVPRRGYRFVAPVGHADSEIDEPAVPSGQPAVTPPTSEAYPLVLDRPSTFPRPLLVAAGVLLVLVVAMAGQAWQRSRSVGTAGGRTGTPAPAGLTRVAVLPFTNLGSPDDTYVAAGMTEEITVRLAGLSRLAVPPNATIANYDRGGKTLQRVAADLGVDYIVEGTAVWEQAARTARVRITPRLIRASDETTVWTHVYEAALPDISASQADIAFQIAGALRVAVDASDRARVDRRHTADNDAYLSYLRGLVAMQQGPWDTANLESARVALEAAVARDPSFALAWSLLSRVYQNQYAVGVARHPATRRAAYHAVRTAIELEPGLPEARLAMASLLAGEGDTVGATRELELAAVGMPNSPERWRLIALMDAARGRWAESRRSLERAFEVDPLSTAEPFAIHYLLQRQYPEARRFIDLAVTANHSGVMVPFAWERFSHTGEVAAARPVLERALAARTPAVTR